MTPNSLLDVAGGDGLSTSRLDVAKVSIVVMDMSTGMLAAAKELRPKIAETIEGDFDDQELGSKLPSFIPSNQNKTGPKGPSFARDKFQFRDCAFDYVTCISALEFASDLRFTLGEMMRVVKPCGLLLFRVFSKSCGCFVINWVMRISAQTCVRADSTGAAHVAPLIVGKMAVGLWFPPLGSNHFFAHPASLGSRAQSSTCHRSFVGFQSRKPLAILLSSYAPLVDAPFMHRTN